MAYIYLVQESNVLFGFIGTKVKRPDAKKPLPTNLLAIQMQNCHQMPGLGFSFFNSWDFKVYIFYELFQHNFPVE